MKIKLNGVTLEVENNLYLDKFIAMQEKIPQYYVVAVNYNCIAMQNYAQIKLQDGDEIEIVTPMQGG